MAQFFDKITYSPPTGPNNANNNNSFGYPAFALYINSKSQVGVSYGEVAGNSPQEMLNGND